MRILVVSLMYPLPTNVARGTFVSDNVELFRSCGHEVKVVNPLPWMLKYQETRRSHIFLRSKFNTRESNNREVFFSVFGS